MSGAHVRGARVWCYAGPQGGECSVPRLVGVTAATTGRRLRMLLEEKMQAVGLDVAAAADRLRVLGAELGFAAREAHLRLCDRLGAVVLLYLLFDTMVFRPDRLWRTGRRDEAERMGAILQRIAGDFRPVTTQYSNIGCWDAVAQCARPRLHLHGDLTGAGAGPPGCGHAPTGVAPGAGGGLMPAVSAGGSGRVPELTVMVVLT